MSWVEQRKHGCRIQDYTQHGLRTLTLLNNVTMGMTPGRARQPGNRRGAPG